MKTLRLTKPVCLVLLLATPACSCEDDEKKPAATTTPAPTPQASAEAPAAKPAGHAVHQVGEVAKTDSYEMTVKNVKECEAKVFRPKEGNIHLGVELLLENTADKEMPINPFYNKLSDDEGYTYNISLKGCTPNLKSVRLDPGEKARGWVTFEVPKKAKGLRLTYRPALGDAAKFMLGR